MKSSTVQAGLDYIYYPDPNNNRDKITIETGEAENEKYHTGDATDIRSLVNNGAASHPRRGGRRTEDGGRPAPWQTGISIKEYSQPGQQT